MAVNDLVLLADAKTFLNVLDTTDDSLISGLITACSDWLENYTQAYFIQRTGIVDYRPGGSKRIFLSKWPVQAITSIVDDSGFAVLPTDYYLETQTGVIRHFGRFPIPQTAYGAPSFWNITYNAGWFASQAAVASSLQLACKMLLSKIYETRTPGVVASKAGDLSVNYFARSDEPLPLEMYSVIGQYNNILM